MSLDALKSNISQSKEIIRELYVFTNMYSKIKSLELTNSSVIDTAQKKLLNKIIVSLTNQLKILNQSIPRLVDLIKFYKELETSKDKETASKSFFKKKEDLVQIKYTAPGEADNISLVIDKKFKKQFLENLSNSNLSIKQLKKKYSHVKPPREFGKPNFYAKLSNRLFRNISKRLVAEGYFERLDRSLRKINSLFLVGTYVSMTLFTILLGFILGFFLFITLLFFNISPLFPFITLAEQGVLIRAFKFFWVIFAIPAISGLIMYLYPATESRSISSRIDQELPFITIHMSAIASSGIEPSKIFQILLKSSEYKYTNKSFRKLMNLINFHGLDIVTALKQTSKSSPSSKLRELLDGIATSITSGGDLHQYLNKRSERLLFDYKLEREKSTRTSETFMNLYISVVIVAPMILLILFVIIAGTGMLSNFIGMDIDTLSILIVLFIALLNIGFLVFLKLKQPMI